MADPAAYQRYHIGSVDRAEVLRYLGYHGQELTVELEGRMDAPIAHCLEVARPAGCVRVFDVAGTGQTSDGRFEMRLSGTALTLVGESMREHMRGAVAVGVLAVTLGLGVDRELRRYAAMGESLDGAVFDAAATALVERAADAAEASIVRSATECGLYTNFRFSPGYGDMPMETQPVLLATLDAQRRLGITLTKTLLMTPTKSVTAVVGMFAEPQESSHATCRGCPCSEFCTLRPTGRTCHG